MTRKKHIRAVSYGEILYDLFPSGKQPGGAPMNVAVNLAKLGIDSTLISRVGNDQNGKELIDYLRETGVRQHFLQIDDYFPTGTVRVDVDEGDNPKYTIEKPVAWDFISDEFLTKENNPDYVIYGSLACRNDVSYESLLELLNSTKAKKILDLNIRVPFYSEDLILNLISQATILKINDDEFNLLSNWFDFERQNIIKSLQILEKKFQNLKMIILTKGVEGSYAWDGSNSFFQPSKKVQVMDTVGSGDAFLSGFISKLNSVSVEEALEFASNLAAFVATYSGANPYFSKKELRNFMKN